MAESIVYKTCITCQQSKPSSDFQIKRSTKNGLSGQCKRCLNKARKERRDSVALDGDFSISRIPTKDLTRFFSKIAVSKTRSHDGTPCWEWTGYAPHGYGVTTWQTRPAFIHRITYAWLIAPLPPYHSNAEIDHICKNKRCCNPLHLELVTAEINMARIDWKTSKQASKTHCKNGHAFTPENTLFKGPNKARGCKICTNASQRRTYRKSRNDPEWRAKERARRHQRYIEHEKPKYQRRRR